MPLTPRATTRSARALDPPCQFFLCVFINTSTYVVNREFFKNYANGSGVCSFPPNSVFGPVSAGERRVASSLQLPWVGLGHRCTALASPWPAGGWGRLTLHLLGTVLS